MERVIKAKLKKQNEKPLLSVPVYQKKRPWAYMKIDKYICV